MEKNLYIDASHPNETRVVLKSEENIEDYEYEGLKNKLIKNNIYLGKVSRIEPHFKQLLLTLEEIDMVFCLLMIFNLIIIKYQGLI
tara:strand:+ start:256 stop:513 length:258 start_codon:yes stop_codon:yes gene_type:complete